MDSTLNPIDYYRLPWSLNDNVLGWLEPTKRCNLYCDGCYSRNDPKSDKSLAEVRSDLEVFVKNRRMDSISIAGGDPLVHPDIVEIVRMIRHDFGLKPILNTNALALTPELLRELKDAGVYGFTCHIDSSQTRAGWKGKTEVELNELRLHYARMVADVGGLCLAFNSTVFRHTIDQVPALVNWARDHIDIVHGMVFILFRTMRSNEYNYFAGGQPIEEKKVVYYDQDKNPAPIDAAEVVAKIREAEPSYDPCAYLGGTVDPQSFKWLVALRLGTKTKTHGYLGRRFMETVQTVHHTLFNRYLAYGRPELLSHGRSTSFGAALFDKGARKAAASYLGSVLKNPMELGQRMHQQSLTIIQPIDFMKDGSTNMCDGCPDMTVHEGELVWSCRLDERKEYGCFLNAQPKCGSGAAPASGDEKRRLDVVAG